MQLWLNVTGHASIREVAIFLDGLRLNEAKRRSTSYSAHLPLGMAAGLRPIDVVVKGEASVTTAHMAFRVLPGAYVVNGLSGGVVLTDWLEPVERIVWERHGTSQWVEGL